MSPLLVGAVAGAAAAFLPRPRVTSLSGSSPTLVDDAGPADWMVRLRLPLSLLAGVAAATFVGGSPGMVAAPLAAVACWRAIGRTEPSVVRRERAELQRELPHLARLMAAALAAGAAPAEAAQAVADALPGPGGARLARAAARLRLGADPVGVWQGLAADPALAPLGRALARGQSSGSSVVASVERLGEELARAARSDAEDRARRVGVKAAVPLGVCLLPSFLLIGIVPLVGGLLTSLRL
ncbi:Type II secretion system (T2SS), protein F [Nocardioides terrae]|uniref:Type II secretion system (T2SS), protein F n=1 Tax=Nocardioides terrae TaxID=574651 RepID=A0A1I1H0M1_9ACTN|nr:type II secretion system F family protein [Nocardioides terrae]SFC17464.1 Type II secretion system (T2SS), protein F [Nocardioides terrae]